MPSAVVTVSATSASPSTARSIRRSSGRSWRATYSVKTGIIAVDRAPSARTRRRMLGMRNATKNASVTGPAPNARATTMSRTNPSTRLTRVAPAIPPRARTTCPSLRLTLKFPRPYGMLHGVPDGESSESKERSRGEYEVGDEARTAERAAPSAQPGDALEDPRLGEDGPRRGGHHPPGGHPRSHPCSRQGREQGRASPQHRRAEEVRARAAPRHRVAPIPPATRAGPRFGQAHRASPPALQLGDERPGGRGRSARRSKRSSAASARQGPAARAE